MVTGGLSVIDGIDYYKIDGVEHMEPFLMTVVSDTDLWMFVSSTGALTAGRVDADHAIFPYETDDKVHRAAGLAGPVTVIARRHGAQRDGQRNGQRDGQRDGQREVWRPFGVECAPSATRSIAKSTLGDRLVFEEHNVAWGLRFRVTWAPAGAHGWVRSVELIHESTQGKGNRVGNQGRDDDSVNAGGEERDESGAGIELEVLDGLLDVMPAGVDASTEQIRSNLVDAYKRSEAGPWGMLAVYTLESLITDRAEPAEALTGTVVWSAGFPDANVDLDLDGRAVAAMIAGRPHARRSSTGRRLNTGRPGAYLLRGNLTVPVGGTASWLMVTDTGLAHPEVVAVQRTAAAPDAAEIVGDDMAAGSARLQALLADADGFQSTAEGVADAHHLSNVLFNSMRGGVFPHDHRVPVADLVDFVVTRHCVVGERHGGWFASLGSWVDAAELRTAALITGDADLIRLVLEYLPLTFSRRHGDPSRPWNRFSINVHGPDGGELLSYEGNWRDIFQNWEALLHSFPAYFAHVVAKFVNASTIDGHNPYRVSRTGIDWEVPDPVDPWSHIGYWGDHQIIYLLRLLEAWEHHEPDAIASWLDRPVFAYADVPYALADHDAIVRDARNTISFDEQHAAAIAAREERIGSDGRLLVDADGELVRVRLAEKLLVPALAKLSNFVPDGGIWLNTQRPEWNDANNALAGPGLSMVTLYHLSRYLRFLDRQLASGDATTLPLTPSVATWCSDLLAAFEQIPENFADDTVEYTADDTSNDTAGVPLDDRGRRTVVDALGTSASDHRRRVRQGIVAEPVDVPVADVRRLCALAGDQLGRSILRARRADGLYHSYNRVSFPTADTARVDHLGAMLEGQVAVLSSGALDADEALAVIDALFESEMYRADQQSFMLYPAVELPAFLDRNVIAADAFSGVAELSDRPEELLPSIFARDAPDTGQSGDDGGPDGGAVGGPDGGRDGGPVGGPEGGRVGGRVGGRDGALRFRPAVINAAELATLLDAATRLDGPLLTSAGRAAIFDVYEAVFDHGSFTGRSGSMYGYEGLGSIYWHMVAKLLLAVQETYWSAVDEGAANDTVQCLADAYDRIRAGLGFLKQPDEFGAIPTDCYSHTPAHAGAQQPGMTGQVKEEILTRFGELGIRVANGRIFLSPGLLPSTLVRPASFSLCSVPMTIVTGGDGHVSVVRSDGVIESRSDLALTLEESRAVFARNGEIARVEWTVGE